MASQKRESIVLVIIFILVSLAIVDLISVVTG